MPDVTAPFGFPYPEDTDLVRDGASDIEALAEGVNDYLTGGYLYAGTRYYTSSGTFAKADAFGDGSNVVPRALMVTVIGAGGGSGAVPATIGGESGIAGPGGGGSGCRTFITNIAGLSTSETITRGAGGAGATTGGGSNGGASIAFGATAPGGFGGEAGAAVTTNQTRGGSDNNAPSGTFDVELQGSGCNASVATNPGANTSVITGKPGTSWLGGRLGDLRDNSAAAAGLVAGEGGRAGASRANVAARNGADGANGIVIIDIYV